VSDDLPFGATPLDPDELDGLIPPLLHRGELNEFESANIIQGMLWASKSRLIKSNFLSEKAMRELHRQMFGETWQWAGKFRLTQKNIGCEAWRIGIALRALLEDVEIWISTRSFPEEEITARFHHRLVWIHPFANGNGRFARLATDLLCTREGWPLSSWGAGNLDEAGELRRRYIRALQDADQHDFGPLIDFMYNNKGRHEES